MMAGESSLTELDWAFAHIPPLADLCRDDLDISPLPGLTNRNYRLHNAQHDWVLRIPRASTNHLIDRAAEEHNQQLACQLGLAPAVDWRNHDGMSLTPTLKNTRQLTPADFDSKLRIHQMASTLRQLHESGGEFLGGLSLAATLEQHYQLLDAPDQARLAPRMHTARRILALLETQDLAPVPSHRDPVMGNLLIDNERLWLIDWEYSAMASPYWDLAILCNAAELDRLRSCDLLRAYCAGRTTMQESLLFDYRGLLKLLNDCWMAAFSGE